MTEATSDIVGILMGITTMWFIISMIIYLWHRDEYGDTQVWKVLSYFNLIKLVRAIFLSLVTPIRIPYRIIKNKTMFHFMSPIDREIWERNQSIRELEDTKDKLVELKRIREREDKLARYIEKEKDELDFEEAEQTLQNGEWKPVNNWLVCPFCGNSFMRNDDHSCEKAQKTSQCPSCHHDSLVTVVRPGYAIRLKECLSCGHKESKD